MAMVSFGRFAIGVMTAMLAAVTLAATDYSKSGTVLTVTVPEGETNEFESTWFTVDLTDIVKAGRGGLRMTTNLSAYEGDIHVDAGTYVFVDNTGLGKLGSFNKNQTENEVGQVYVADGATLECAAPATASNAGKIVHFQGSGVDGIGALVWNSTVNQTQAFGVNLFMEGDAYIHALRDREVGFSASEVHLNMHAHTLTFRHEYAGRVVYFVEVRVWEPGNFVQNGPTAMLIQNYNQLQGTKANTHTLNDQSCIKLQKRGGALNRTLIWNSECTNAWEDLRMPPSYASDEPRTYQGPVVLNQTMTTYGGMIFGDAVSGEGGITHIGAPAPVNFLKFTSSDLTFTGPFSVYDTDVTLPETGNFALGEGLISVAEENTFAGGLGTWSKLVKTGDGVLNYNSKLGSDYLEVKGGTIKLAYKEETAADVAGMTEGVGWYEYSNAGWTMLAEDRDACYAYQQRVMPGLTGIYSGVTDIKKRPDWLTTEICPSKARYLLTYSGYIWNHSDEPVTWSFGGCILVMAVVGVEGEDGEVHLALNADNSIPFKHANVTLKPGPNKFWAACAHVENDGGAPSSFKNFYLRYDPQGRNSDNSEDYQIIENVAGQPPLLTWKLPGESVLYPRNEAYFNRELVDYGTDPVWIHGPIANFGNLSFAPGTGIDFAGADYSVSQLSGVPRVANCGEFTISENWTVTTADLAVAQPMAFEKLTFGMSTLKINPADATILGSKTEWTLATSVAEIDADYLKLDASAVSSLGAWELVVEEHALKLRRTPPGLIMIIE